MSVLFTRTYSTSVRASSSGAINQDSNRTVNQQIIANINLSVQSMNLSQNFKAKTAMVNKDRHTKSRNDGNEC